MISYKMLTIVLLVFVSQQSISVEAIPLPERMLEEGRFLIIPIGGQTVYDNDIQDLTVGRMAHSYEELGNVLFRMGSSAEPREEEEEEELFLTLWPLVTSEGSSLPTTGQRSELSGDNFVMK